MTRVVLDTKPDEDPCKGVSENRLVRSHKLTFQLIWQNPFC